MPTAYEKYLANYQEEQQQPSTGTVAAQTDDAFQLDDGKKSLSAFASDETFMSNLKTYAIDRYGKDEAEELFFPPEEGENNEDKIERFLTHIREFDNSLGLASQVDWQRNATKEQRENFGDIYSQIEAQLPTFWEKGGGDTGKGILDHTLFMIADPLNLIGLGIGKIIGRLGMEAVKRSFIIGGREAAIKTATKITKKEAAKKAATPFNKEAAKKAAEETASKVGTKEALGAAAGYGVLSVGENVLRQEVDQAAIPDEEQETSYLQAGIAGGLGAVAGGGASKLAASLGYRSNIKTLGKMADADEKAREAARKAGITTPKESVTDDGADVIRTSALADAPELTYEYNPKRGMELLKDVEKLETSDAIRFTEDGVVLEPTDRLTNPVVVTDVMKQMADFAYDLVKISQDEGIDLGLNFNKPNVKASEWIQEILSLAGTDRIDSDILQKALRKNGLSEADILDMVGASYTEVGKALRTASPIGALLKKIRELDPVAAKKLDAFADGVDKTVPSAFSAIYDFVRRIDRERRALMTSQLSTTARNTATAIAAFGMGTFMNAIDSALFHAGKGIQSAIAGEASMEGFKGGLKNVVKDTFSLLAALDNPLRSKELSNQLLKHNPRIARIIDRTMTEVGAEDAQQLSKFTRLVNFANIAQDGFLRRAVFTDSVERQLRREGLDLTTQLENNKNIPVKVLQKAADEALEFTFSRMPKAGGDKVGDTLGYHFVKITEALPLAPVGTGTHPFARFMVNAMQFQYEYSPLNALSATERLFRYGQKRGLKDLLKPLAKEGSEAELLLASARKKFSQSIVGSAALVAAIQYRAENQEKIPEWYNMGTSGGRNVDMRPFFPLAPYLLVADVLVKLSEGNSGAISSKSIYEGLTGSMSRTGREGLMVDGFFEALEGEGSISGEKGTVRIAEGIGKWLGEIGGQYMTPTRLVNDAIRQFSPTAALTKDSNIIEGEGAIDRGAQAFWNKFSRNIPILEQLLPTAENPTADRDIYEKSSVIKAFFGVRFTEKKTAAELELRNHGFEAWQVVLPTGDKTADRYVKRFMGPLVAQYIGELINSKEYLKDNKVRKKNKLNKMLITLRKRAKLLGNAQAIEDRPGRYTPFDRAKWLKLSKIKRAEANIYYMQNYGKTVTEAQQQEPNEPHFLRGVAIGTALTK